MKPIEYCLDTVLNKLEDNYDIEPYPALQAGVLLSDFEVPKERHEFFKGLINILIDDGYADFLDYKSDRKAVSLGEYQSRVMMLPKGFYFLKNGGYTQKSIDEKNVRALRDSRDKRLSNGTVYLAIGTFLLVAVETAIHWKELKELFGCH